MAPISLVKIIRTIQLSFNIKNLDPYPNNDLKKFLRRFVNLRPQVLAFYSLKQKRKWMTLKEKKF
jgi:hypothetical protein